MNGFMSQKFITYLLLLILFSTLGYWSGKTTSAKALEILYGYKPNSPLSKNIIYPIPQNLVTSSSSHQASENTTSHPDNSQASLQQNILVIGVTNLVTEQPELRSVWMVLYLTDSTHLTLMPIYPSITQGNAALALKELFHLDATGTPDQQFLKALQEQNLWWNNIVIIDEAALTTLINFVQSATRTPLSEDLALILSGTPQDNQTSLGQQTQLLRDLCDAAGDLEYLPDASNLYQLIPIHLTSDLMVEKFISDWQLHLALGSHLTCEFPFLISP
jgi:hypothetical protein